MIQRLAFAIAIAIVIAIVIAIALFAYHFPRKIDSPQHSVKKRASKENEIAKRESPYIHYPGLFLLSRNIQGNSAKVLNASHSICYSQSFHAVVCVIILSPIKGPSTKIDVAKKEFSIRKKKLKERNLEK